MNAMQVVGCVFGLLIFVIIAVAIFASAERSDGRRR